MAGRRRGSLGGVVLPFVVAFGALAGCSGDHGFLAEKKVEAGPPDDAAIADVRGDEARVVVPPVDAADSTSEASVQDLLDEPLPPEPPGRWSLTWIHGLADVDRARFCFVPVVGGRELRAQVVAEPAAGLPFGKSLILAELQGVDLTSMDVHPYAVIGEGAPDAGLGCADLLDAADSGALVGGDDASRTPVAIALPQIPAGTLGEGRSYLGVVTGCARPWPYSDVEAGTDAARDGAAADTSVDGTEGGDAPVTDGTMIDVFRPPARAAICGASTGGPNAGLVLVRLSQRDVGMNFGLQVVHASAAVAGARIVVDRRGGAMPILSADVGPYQIAPRDGLIAVAKDDFGPTVGAATVRVVSPGSVFPATSFPLASALTASDIDEASLVPGDLFSFVLIGAEPGQNPGPPWNPAGIVVVRNAPLAGSD